MKTKKSNTPKPEKPRKTRFTKAGYIHGIYLQVARELGKSRGHVRYVAEGARQSRAVSDALAKHLKRPKMDFVKGGAE